MKFCSLGDIIGARTSAVDSALAKKKKKLMDGASLYPLDAGDLLEVFLMSLKYVQFTSCAKWEGGY